MSVQNVNLIGAITANAYMLFVIAIFIARMVGQPELGRWIGLASTLVIVPLVFLFAKGFSANRPLIYFVWLGLMILFVLVEIIIDHIFQLNFRGVQWAVILYVMFFFGATGGMIGVAAQAGKLWASITGIIFLIMAALAFIQRAMTGL